MYFVFHAKDKPGHLDVRKANREEHIAFLRSMDNLKFAGPLLDDDGLMIGSLLVFEADSKKDVEDLLAKDPYAKAGLFASTEITGLNWLIGAPQ